jgi:N-acetylmuramoyl-L-alanine amidase
VVALDPGHGGCLDWGVPDPLQRGIAFSEKTMTLAIASELRAILEAEGITVVMTRTDDSALAGDDYPDLDCNGPPWRDVNGDGELGFIPDDPEGAVRTRDELQARLDLANVARADMLISIHINSLTQDGVVFEIAATETFYTDETPWGVPATLPLAEAIQAGVLAALDPLANYERQDRGVEAHNLYIVAPPLLEETPERPDRRKQPTRGALMPSVLTEVGSITLRAEQELLASSPGQRAAAEGIAEAFATYLGARPLAVRYDALVDGGEAGDAPVARDEGGPPFWVPELTAPELTIRVTNTGMGAWPDDLVLAAGWEASDQPYLRIPPASLADVDVAVPPLAPGEAVELELPALEPPAGGRHLLWLTLVGEQPFTQLGSPPLQLGLGG